MKAIMNMTGRERTDRDQRQRDVLSWAHDRFDGMEGVDVSSPYQRYVRLLEEVVELGQALGFTTGQIDDFYKKVSDYCLGRKNDDPFQEIGGVMVTLMALAENANHMSVADAEAVECHRISGLSREHFQKRQAEKRDAGL